MNKIFLIAVLIVGLSQMAVPLETKIKEGTLSIIQKEGKIENNTDSKKVPDKTLNAINEYIIHKDEQIKVEIKDPNFFLFVYKYEERKSETEDFTALNKFIEAFIGIEIKTEAKMEAVSLGTKEKLEDVIALTGREIRNEIEKSNSDLCNKKREKEKQQNNLETKKEANKETIKGMRIAQEKEESIHREINILNKQEASINEKINQLSEEEKSIKEKIDNLSKVEALINGIERIGITTDSLNNLSRNTKSLSEMIQMIPTLICKISSGLSGAGDANKSIDEWDRDTEKAIGETYGKIKEAIRILSENTGVIAKLGEYEKHEDVKIRENIQFIHDALLLFTTRESVVKEMLDKVNAFKTEFLKMYDPEKKEWIPLPLGTITYSEKEKITANIEISMAEKIPDEVKKCLDLKKEAQKTGKFQIVFDPYTPVKISFSLAEILSSLKAKGEDDENEKNIRLTVPMITITPNFKLWEINYLRLGFQIGGTVKDKTKNILMGAGLQLLERIFIGGGIHLRWGNDIDLKGGWYINIGFNVISTK